MIAWTLLQDAALDEAVDGDGAGAATQYEMLTRSLATDDPVRLEALYRLARVRFASGDADGARAALREAILTAGPGAGAGRERCLDLLGEIEIVTAGVHAVPTLWTFDGAHGLVHPHTLDDVGAVRIVADPLAGGVLEWQTSVEARGDDHVVFGIDAVDAKILTFRVTSLVGTGRVTVELIDDRGVPTVFPDVVVAAGTWTPVEVPFDGPVDRVVFRRPAVPGDSILRLDDVAVR